MHNFTKSVRKYLTLIFLGGCFLTAFFSCSSSSSKKSFLTELDSVDALIKQGFYSDAVEELEKLEKLAYNSWGQLGIFKRYVKLSEKEKAESFLASCVKKNPENLELAAILTDFYNAEKQYEKAVACGEKLKGTKFGSFYSEAFFSNLIYNSNPEDYFYKPEFYQMYSDAYTGTKEQKWLRNCAVINLLSGQYSEAAKICPEPEEKIEIPFFWALVMYDSENYGESIYFADEALKTQNVNKAQVFALKSDSYSYLLDQESAESNRQEYLSSLKKDRHGNYIFDSLSENYAPIILTNSAVWAMENEADDDALKMILPCVTKWPDFFPGLKVYSNFAYRTNIVRKESAEQLTLRDYGMATLEMEKYDNRVKVPLSDAVSRINSSIERKKTPELYLLSLDLKYKTDPNLSTVKKVADIYGILERNTIGKDLYPDSIVNFAVRNLILNGKTEDARTLFYKFISQRYNIPLDISFWRQVVSKLSQIDFSQAEILAYFAAETKRADEAIRLYEYCVFEVDGDEEAMVISPVVSDSTCTNLGAVYYGSNQIQKALNFYSKLTGRLKNKELKSEVFYRISKIYFEKGDFLNARINADYSLTLNRKNVQSKLLLSQIDDKKNGQFR